MPIAIVRVLAVVSIAVYLVPTGAHLFELSAKLAMSPSEYMTVQGIYRGWAQFGVVIFAAMLLTLLHAVMRRGQRTVFILSLGSLFLPNLRADRFLAVHLSDECPQQQLDRPPRALRSGETTMGVLAQRQCGANLHVTARDRIGGGSRCRPTDPTGRVAPRQTLIVISGICVPDW